MAHWLPCEQPQIVNSHQLKCFKATLKSRKDELHQKNAIQINSLLLSDAPFTKSYRLNWQKHQKDAEYLTSYRLDSVTSVKLCNIWIKTNEFSGF